MTVKKDAAGTSGPLIFVDATSYYYFTTYQLITAKSRRNILSFHFSRYIFTFIYHAHWLPHYWANAIYKNDERYFHIRRYFHHATLIDFHSFDVFCSSDWLSIALQKAYELHFRHILIIIF